MSQFSFTVHHDGQSVAITEVELAEYAELIGLSAVAPGRCSWLCVLKVFLHERFSGVDTSMLLEAMRALEGKSHRLRTKPETQFKHPPLAGLWHKHFFSAQFVGQNLQSHFGRGGIEKLVREVLDPDKSPVVTKEMIEELARRVTVDAFETRDGAGKLTGEWIVFAMHEGQRFYLTISTHESGDDVIFSEIQSVCFRQFPFLEGKAGGASLTAERDRSVALPVCEGSRFQHTALNVGRSRLG